MSSEGFMVVGYLLIGLLAGLTVATIALLAGVSPLLALGLHSLVGSGVVLLIVFMPLLRPLVALAAHTRSHGQAGP